MALTDQIVPYVFTEGIHTEMDPKINMQGLLRAENVVVNRHGALEKRTGHLNFGDGTTGLITSIGSRLLQLTSGVLYAYENTSTAKTTVGYFDHMDLVPTDVISGSDSWIRNVEIYEDATNNLTIVTYNKVVGTVLTTSTYGVYLAVYKRSSMTLVSTTTLFSGVAATSCASVSMMHARILPDATSGCCTVFFLNGSGTLRYAKVSNAGAVTGPSDVAGAATALVNSTYVGTLDAVTYGTQHCVAYVDENSDIEIVWTTLGVTAVNAAETHAATTTKKVSLIAMTSHVAVLFDHTSGGVTDGYVNFYDTSRSVVGADVKVFDGAGLTRTCEKLTGIATSSTSVTLLAQFSTSSLNYIKKNTCTVSGTAGTEAAESRQLAIHSKPWLTTGTSTVYYLTYWAGSAAWAYWKRVEQSAQRTFLVYAVGGRVAGKAFPGRAYDIGGSSVVTPIRSTSTTDEFYGAVAYQIATTASAVAKLTIDAAPSWIQSVETATNRMFASSLPMEYDGTNLFEQGFIQYPDGITTLRNATAGGQTTFTAGTYYYTAVYRYTDARGNVHRSAYAPPVAQTLNAVQADATDKITVTIPTLHATRKMNVAIELYRTVSDGSIYYYVGETQNTTTTSTTTIEDTDEDDELGNGAYFNGGVLENVQPSQYQIMTLWKNRLFYVDSEDNRSCIRYTKSIQKAVGVEHNDALSVYITAEDGPITALTAIDDKLIIFKTHRIYMLTGEPLDDLGQGVGFDPEVLVTAADGTAVPRSIVHGPQGIFFKGTDSIALLDRGLGYQKIGSPVDYYLSGKTITGAHYIQQAHRIAFLSTSTGALIFDTDAEKWFRFSGYASEDSCVIDDVLYFKRYNASGVDYESYVYYVDGASSEIVSTIETGWFSFANVGGFKRVRRVILIGQNVGTHTLGIQFGYDFDPNWCDAQTFASSGLTAFDVGSYFTHVTDTAFDDQALLLEASPSRQKLTSIRCRIYDASPTTSGGSFSITGIAFVVAVERGARRINSARVMT